MFFWNSLAFSMIQRMLAIWNILWARLCWTLTLALSSVSAAAALGIYRSSPHTHWVDVASSRHIKNPSYTAWVLIAVYEQQSISVEIEWVGLWSLVTFLLSFVLWSTSWLWKLEGANPTTIFEFYWVIQLDERTLRFQ